MLLCACRCASARRQRQWVEEEGGPDRALMPITSTMRAAALVDCKSFLPFMTTNVINGR